MSEVVATSEIEEAVFRAKLAGKSTRAIAQQFGLSSRAVNRICIEHLPEIDDEYRRREVGLELARLDLMLETFLRKAITESDAYAGTLVLKISERRSAYLGLDRPVRVDPVVMVHTPVENNVQKIRAIIERVTKKPEQSDVIPFRSETPAENTDPDGMDEPSPSTP